MNKEYKFNEKYHAKLNRAATQRDTRNPCKFCGWSKYMAIHDDRNFYIPGYGHRYMSLSELPIKQNDKLPA